MVSASPQHLEPATSNHPGGLRTIRPIGVYQLYGIAFAQLRLPGVGNPKQARATPYTLLALDAVRGYLLQVDRESDNTTILNPYQVDHFLNATGLTVDESTATLWFCRDDQVYWCSLPDFTPQPFIRLRYPANGVAISGATVYVTCQKAGYILIFDRATGQQLGKFPAPGVGIEDLSVRGDQLWVCDRTEQSVYCLDRTTGELRFSLLTPFEYPTGLAFCPDSETLYVAYAAEESYIRDNPNNLENPLEIAIRDRTFIHPLYFRHLEADRCALSNGYLIEMSYVEELSPLDPVHLENLEWRIALPAETPGKPSSTLNQLAYRLLKW